MLFCGLLITVEAAVRPQFSFSKCGGAASCMGKRNLTRVLVKSGLSNRSDVTKLAALLDSDDDLVSS